MNVRVVCQTTITKTEGEKKNRCQFYMLSRPLKELMRAKEKWITEHEDSTVQVSRYVKMLEAARFSTSFCIVS